MEHWMDKYEKDVEAKQKELDVLKASKAKDLERLQELTKLVSLAIKGSLSVFINSFHPNSVFCCENVNVICLS